MTELDKKILRQGRKALYECTVTTWKSGDLTQMADWGRDMKAVIHNFLELTTSIVSSTYEQSTSISVLKAGRKVLRDSTVTTWQSGDLEQWSRHVKLMKAAIETYNLMTRPILEESDFNTGGPISG